MELIRVMDAAAKESDDLTVATRASLLERLRDVEDQSSWKSFYNTYARLILGIARRAGLPEAEAEDVLQETVISVAKHLPGFVYDPKVCSFRTWMLRLTRWRIMNRFGKHFSGSSLPSVSSDESASGDSTESLADRQWPDFDAIWREEWEEAALAAALENIKRKISPEQFQMFDLYALRGMNVGEVASILGTNVPRVYLARHRVTAMLRREIKVLEESGW